MTESNVEVGPIVAAAMIAIGLATVVWAVATNPRQPVELPRLHVSTGTTAPSFGVKDPEPSNAITDDEWEQTLIDVEKIKTDRLVTHIDPSTQVATVSAEKWAALDAERKREVGRHLAVYCGRISGSDEHHVEVRDEGGAKLESYDRD